MKPKMYYLIGSDKLDVFEMKVIAVFKMDEYDRAIQAWKDCPLFFKEIVETIYG